MFKIVRNPVEIEIGKFRLSHKQFKLFVRKLGWKRKRAMRIHNGRNRKF